MDFLQGSLVFLILLLAVFLSITGFQVFLILKDMKKSLNRLNELLFSDDEAKKLKAAGELTGNDSPVLALCFSADGAKLAGAAKDKSMHIWEVASKKAFSHVEAPAGRVGISRLPSYEEGDRGSLDGWSKFGRGRFSPMSEPCLGD